MRRRPGAQLGMGRVALMRDVGGEHPPARAEKALSPHPHNVFSHFLCAQMAIGD